MSRRQTRGLHGRISWLALAAPAVLGFAVGCTSSQKVVVHTFTAPPASWIELSAVRSGSGPRLVAPLEVRAGHLDLSGSRALLETTPFTAPSGGVDLAITSPDDNGFAGVFLLPQGGGRPFCLGLRPRHRGEWRAYRAEDPLRPEGGAGWQPRDRGTSTGFSRLSFAVRGGAVVFHLDGREVARYDEPTAASGARPGERRWQVGVFSHGVTSRWNSFVVGDLAGEGMEGFSPDAYVDWGDTAAAAELGAEFRGVASRFRSAPTRTGIFEFAASLEAGLAAYLEEEDAERHEALRREAAAAAAELRSAARRIGEEELLVAALRATARTLEERQRILGVAGADFAARGREAESLGRIAEALACYATAIEVAADPEVERRFAALRGRLPALGFALEIESVGGDRTLLPPERFREHVMESYGGLPRTAANRLAVHLRIERSELRCEVEPAVRKVLVAAGGAGMDAAERSELERLESSRFQDLDEALASAEVLRASAQVLGRGAVEHLQSFTLDGKRHELHANDGRRLERDFARYRALKDKWDRVAGKMRTETVDGERTTVSIRFKATLELHFNGRRIVGPERFDEYLGLELWKHGAVAEKGIERSVPSQRDIDSAVEALSDRVLRRFARLVSKANVVSRLEPADKLGFLVALARGTRRPQDEVSLQWALEQELGLSSVVRDGVARRLLE